MSFNINGPSNIPSIQETQNMKNNGGGGNLGYFMREESDDIIRFSDEQEEDSFEKLVDLQDDEESFDLFQKIVRFLKKLWYSFVKLFIPKAKNAQDKFIKNN